MTRNLFFFRWYVDTGGYVTERRIPTEDKDKKQQLMVIRLPGSTPGRRLYQPMQENTPLFRIFAGLDDQDRDQILGFANTYGLLGEGVFVRPEGGRGVSRRGEMSGELYGKWQEEIHEMQQALRLWDYIQDKDTLGLSKYVSWHGNSVHYDYGEGGGVIASENINRGDLDMFPPGDLFMPAECVVQTIINKQIDGRVSPRLLWDERPTKSRLYMVPKSLIGAIWLQFSQTVDGNIQFLVCPECEKPFAVNKSARGKPRIYCSDSCRFRAHRKKKAGAKS